MCDNSEQCNDLSFSTTHSRLSLIALLKRKKMIGVDAPASDLFEEEVAADCSVHPQVKKEYVEDLSFCDSIVVNDVEENSENEGNLSPSYDLHDDCNFPESNTENFLLKSIDQSDVNLPEEYVEVNGKYVEASALAFSKDGELNEIENVQHSKEHSSIPVTSCVDESLNEIDTVTHFESYCDVPDVEHYKWSCLIETEEERNQIYDQWMCDIESWERNRLVWLDNLASSKGYDPHHDKDRTFLVKVENLCHLSKSDTLSQSKVTSVSNAEACDLISDYRKMILAEDFSQSYSYTLSDTEKISETLDAMPLPTNNGNVEPTEPTHSNELIDESPICQIEGKSASWDEWYDYMRLQRHKRLLEMGLPNWYEELCADQMSKDIVLKSDNSSYEDQFSEYVSVPKGSYISDQDYLSENCEVLSTLCSSEKLEFDPVGNINATACYSFKEHFDENEIKNENCHDSSLIMQIPHENILVYQFTDRNMWSKFRKWPKSK